MKYAEQIFDCFIQGLESESRCFAIYVIVKKIYDTIFDHLTTPHHIDTVEEQ